MSRIILSDALFEALQAAGVLRPEDSVRRVVIDLKVGEVAVLHLERYGDERLLNLVPGLDGVEIRRDDPAVELAPDLRPDPLLLGS